MTIQQPPPHGWTAHDGVTYQGQPPPGFWQASDGRWYPPQQQQPPAMQPQPKRSKAGPPTFVILCGVLLGGCAVLGAIGAVIGDDEEPEAEAVAVVDDSAVSASTEPASFFMPQPEGDADPQFWMTTFGLVIPAGHWEPNSVDPELCGPTTSEDLWTLTTEEGTPVAAFDNAPLLTFGRVDSVMDDAGNCTVVAATMGDYIDDLSNSYTISDGTLEATFTPEQLFAGQDDGADHYQVLQPR